MKPLFNEKYETYTPEAINISKIFGHQIREWLDKYCREENYSINDISIILHDEVSVSCSEFKLIRNMEFKKKERSK